MTQVAIRPYTPETDGASAFDLMVHLAGYTTPAAVMAAMEAAEIRIETATPQDSAPILRFEGHNFPAWLRYYEQWIAQGGVEDIVLARGADNAILGTSFAMNFGVPANRNDFVWH